MQMSKVAITIEGFSERTTKEPREMLLTLQRNIDRLLALPDGEQNRFIVNYIIQLAKVITPESETTLLDYQSCEFWGCVQYIQQKKEDRQNGVA